MNKKEQKEELEFLYPEAVHGGAFLRGLWEIVKQEPITFIRGLLAVVFEHFVTKNK